MFFAIKFFIAPADAFDNWIIISVSLFSENDAWKHISHRHVNGQPNFFFLVSSTTLCLASTAKLEIYSFHISLASAYDLRVYQQN